MHLNVANFTLIIALCLIRFDQKSILSNLKLPVQSSLKSVHIYKNPDMKNNLKPSVLHFVTGRPSSLRGQHPTEASPVWSQQQPQQCVSNWIFTFLYLPLCKLLNLLTYKYVNSLIKSMKMCILVIIIKLVKVNETCMFFSFPIWPCFTEQNHTRCLYPATLYPALFSRSLLSLFTHRPDGLSIWPHG